MSSLTKLLFLFVSVRIIVCVSLLVLNLLLSIHLSSVERPENNNHAGELLSHRFSHLDCADKFDCLSYTQ